MIAIKKLQLGKERDSSQTLMHFEIIYIYSYDSTAVTVQLYSPQHVGEKQKHFENLDHEILQMTNTTIPKNCVEVKHTFPYALDGEYELHIGTNDDPLVLIYCHGMNTNMPSEYLTLPAGECNLQYHYVI